MRLTWNFFYLSVCIYIYSYIFLTSHVLKVLHCKFKQITEVEFSGGKDRESKHQKVFLNVSYSLVDYSG